MFTFNEEDNKSTAELKIFNGGEAGKVKDVSISVQRKGVDYEGERVPPYKIIFTDSAENTTDQGFYYMEKEGFNSQYGTFEEGVQKQWKKLAHLLEVSGEDFTISNCTPKEMLDQMMSRVNEATSGKKYNVIANYGNTSSPGIYIKVRTWAPYAELAGTEPSKLKVSNLDQIERLTPDAPKDTAAKGWGA